MTTLPPRQSTRDERNATGQVRPRRILVVDDHRTFAELLTLALLSPLAVPANRPDAGTAVGPDAGAASRPAPVIDVTPRERQVLELLGQGLDARVIARTLGISLHTSRGHVKSLLAKLHAHSQLE